MLSAEDFAVQSRNEKREMELSKLLRTKNMDERWEYISTALDADKISNLPNALVIAHRIKLSKDCLYKILDISLLRADPSSMNWYLSAVISGLGYQAVVSYFRKKIESNTEQVGMALYFLPNLPLTTSEIQSKQIIKLRQEFKAHVNACDIVSPYLKACVRN
ncbi:MAG: hypothetical protein HRU38_16040 [Saccharospirillaceae bacterium]|nr:hypothetical protein [Pseudomonadales bacterium]NRB80153.1 hypothetical protein [Saccharospirillaceae bacterium]